MLHIHCFLGALFTLALTHESVAQSVDADQQSGVVFKPTSSFGAGSVKLINGQAVDEQDWRALFVAVIGEYVDKDGRKIPKTCSATLVGRGVALTAAHCIDAKGNKSTQRKAALQLPGLPTIVFDCAIPAQYLEQEWDPRGPRHPDDFALCTFTVPDPVPPRIDVRFEALSFAPVGKAASVLMTGFGCKVLAIDANGLVGVGQDNVLTIGDSVVESASDGQRFLTTRSNWKTQPALCPGDSGGPLMVGATTATPTGTRQSPRRIIGVNSNVVPVARTSDGYDLISRMAPMTSSAFVKFMADWQQGRSGFTICGAPNAKAGYPCRD
ncbi:trypsin-like serine protease [Sphingomonas gilva]|nr:trypsin-like serine protease [Sphingomonas gilva]